MARTRRIVIGTLAALAAAPVTAAQADAQWLNEPLVVFPGSSPAGTGSQGNDAVAVGMSARGDVVAVYNRNDASTSRPYVSIRPAGGAVGAPTLLVDEAPRALDLAVAPDGTALAVWSSGSSAATSVLRYALRPPGGAFGAAQTIAGTDRIYVGPRVTVDGAGDFTVAWERLTDDSTGAEVKALRRAADGTLGTIQTLSDTQASNPLDLAENAAGDTVVAWSDGFHLAGTYKPGGATAFPAATTLGADGAGGVLNVDTAVSPSGAAGVSWWQALDDGSGGGVEQRVRAVTRAAGASTFSPRATISSADAAGFPFGLLASAFDGSGAYAVVDVRQSPAGTYHLERVNVQPGGSAGSPEVIPADPGGTFEPVLAADATGRLLLSFRLQSSLPSKLRVAMAPPGGAFSAPVPIGPTPADTGDQRSLKLATDANGNGVLLFNDSNYHGGAGDPPAEIHMTGFDGAGPLLDGLSAPATGTTGAALAFGVTPVDVWSPVSTTRWSFGDGTGADGTTVQHAFGAGDHAVTVTATDSRGNATTSAARTVHVTTPSIPPPVDRTAPVLTRVSLLRSRFRVGAAATPVAARAAAGTAFRFTLSEPARVAIAIVVERPGRKVRGRCRATGPRTAQRCTRLVARGTLTRNLPAGAARVTFTGRIGRRRLAPGRYRAALVAVDAAGNRSAAKTVRFRIVTR